jgi:predicted transcriptional regulator
MASVYKTLSKSDSHEKEPGEKRNKQRVLILVRLSQKIAYARAEKSRVREVSHSAIAISCRICTR